MLKHCPGVKNLISPEKLIVRICPHCSDKVEFFNDEFEMKCQRCGQLVKIEPAINCIIWCQNASKCIIGLKNIGLLSHSKAKELEEIAMKTNLNSKS